MRVANPSYLPCIEALLEENRVVVWRLPPHLSQSRLGGRESPSNACTLIVLHMAELIYRQNIPMPYGGEPITSVVLSEDFVPPRRQSAGHNSDLHVEYSSVETLGCPSGVLSCFVESIVLGNDSHERAVGRRLAENATNTDQNFTIPAAIEVTGKTFMESDFCSVRNSIGSTLSIYLRSVINSPCLAMEPRIFVIMIAFERSVLLVFERKSLTLTIFDSHSHGTTGGIIAACHVSQMGTLTDWVVENIFPEAINNIYQDFELSVIRFCGTVSHEDCVSPSVLAPLPVSIFSSPPPRRVAVKRPASDRRLFSDEKEAKRMAFVDLSNNRPADPEMSYFEL